MKWNFVEKKQPILPFGPETDDTEISGLIPILILWLPLNRYRDWYRDSEEPPIDTGTDTDTQRSPQSIPILILIPGPQSILILIPILILHKVFNLYKYKFQFRDAWSPKLRIVASWLWYIKSSNYSWRMSLMHNYADFMQNEVILMQLFWHFQ